MRYWLGLLFVVAALGTVLSSGCAQHHPELFQGRYLAGNGEGYAQLVLQQRGSSLAGTYSFIPLEENLRIRTAPVVSGSVSADQAHLNIGGRHCVARLSTDSANEVFIVMSCPGKSNIMLMRSNQKVVRRK
jgi:hypothetical protein